MKKDYPYLKQFFEQHKTKHNYESFVRHRSPERLRQLDEICSDHSYKTRFEEYLKLSDKESITHKTIKIIKRILNYLDSIIPEDATSCLLIIIMVGIFLYCCYEIKNLLIVISLVFVLFILIFPLCKIDNVLRCKKQKRIAKSFPFFYYAYPYYGHDHGMNSLNEISNKFAEECDVCLQKFFDDFKLFFHENQKDISKVIYFYNKYRKERRDYKIEVKIEAIYNCFYYTNFARFYYNSKDDLDSVCAYIKDSGKIVSEELYQIDFNNYENRIKQQFNKSKYNPKKAYIYTTWICLNLLCIVFTGYVFKTKYDLKDRAIASLYQKSYAQYEKNLKNWENGVFVKISTSMTDYYLLGEDISYEYQINGIGVSSNCIVGMPKNNNFNFGVSITEYDDTYSDYGYSGQSLFISTQDLINGYKVVLDTYVHENSNSATQGYARFRTVFTLSFHDENNKPKEPQKSNFNDKVDITFSDAFKSAIGLK